MKDVDFLLTKITILEKVKAIFLETETLLRKKVEPEFALHIPSHKGKISRGENYHQLPYIVLDYPAYFSRENIFTFRTLFWWGHFFSATLHLQGSHLHALRPKLTDRFDLLLNQDIFICIGSTPWEYHYGVDNYQPLGVEHLPFLQQTEFLKLSRKYPLDDWQVIPKKVVSFFEIIQNVLVSPDSLHSRPDQ